MSKTSKPRKTAVFKGNLSVERRREMRKPKKGYCYTFVKIKKKKLPFKVGKRYKISQSQNPVGSKDGNGWNIALGAIRVKCGKDVIKSRRKRKRKTKGKTKTR